MEISFNFLFVSLLDSLGVRRLVAALDPRQSRFDFPQTLSALIRKAAAPPSKAVASHRTPKESKASRLRRMGGS
jgi:hypothetical protein